MVVWILLFTIVIILLFYFWINTSHKKVPPQQAIEACHGKASGDICVFSTQAVTDTWTCNDKAGVFACAPDRNIQSNTIQWKNSDEEQRIKILSIATQEKEKTINLYNQIVLLNQEWIKINIINSNFIQYEKDLQNLIWSYDLIIENIEAHWFSQSLKEQFILLTEQAKSLVEKVKAEIVKIKSTKKQTSLSYK